MITSLIWILLFLGIPALVLAGCERFTLLDTIGGVVICYALGIIIGNSGLLPDDIFIIQDYMTTLTVPIALPLIFFSMHMAKWKEQSGMVLRAFFGALVAVLIGSVITFFIFRGVIGEEAWKIAGMLVGCYTGGTPNMAAIGTALNVGTSDYIAVHASDVVVSGFLFLLIISILPKVIRRILPVNQMRSEHPETVIEEVHGMKEFTPYFSGFNRQDLPPLLRAFLFSVLIFAVGGGVSMLVPAWAAPVTAIIVITTLGIAGSFIPAVRQTPFTFQLGYYVLLVFSFVVSSMADLQQLTRTAPIMMGYVLSLLVITFVLHVIASKVLRVDADTQLVTATALIFSPPFVPVVAASLKNRSVIMAGMVAGIAGWLVGNYIGIAFGYLMRLL
ncbi:MAG: DUF819 family protein [Spirochaetia bacterium]|nr:DUF819 family protein [Spirochaetia bacterium]MCF7941617.1 DUF819 family protein [Spirochaetia bacterium]